MNSTRRNLFRTAIIVAVALSLLLGIRAFATLQDRLVDQLFLQSPVPGNIVLIEIDETSINSIGQWPWPRSVFGSLIEKLQSAAVIGIDINFKEPSRVGLDDDAQFARSLASSHIPIILTADIQADGSVSFPLSTLRTVSFQGFPNLLIAPDDAARYLQFQKSETPSFALQIARYYAMRRDLLAPVVPSKPVRIAYRGPHGTFSSVRFVDVINNAIPDSFFKDKIVLVGATARDLQDYHHTPFGITSGVEIQANIIDTLLSKNFFRSSVFVTYGSIWLLAFAIVTLSVSVRQLALLILSVIGSLAVYNGLALLAFDNGFILDLFYPNLAILAGAAVGVSAQYFAVSRERKFIQDTFSRYLAPQVIAELLRDPSQLKLGGAKRYLTILFADIRSFTTISESLSPEQLTKFLNEYLTTMTDIILKHEGLVDKYIGDAIMAFWGAPVENIKHPQDAVRAAIAMIDALHAFNRRHDGSGMPPINIGIGINTGDVTVGNMGSEKRFDFTVMGDSVNLASRLEGLSKTYGANIIIGENTYSELSDPSLMCRELDRVQVKGKKNVVRIFEVVPTYYRPQVQKIIEQFNQARTVYYAGQWKEALATLGEILKEVPHDGPSKILQTRCLEFVASPPEHWEGVFEHTHK